MTSLSDKQFTDLQTAINKAINNLETPVKQKHVRSTIIGTFQEKGAQTFWIVVLRLPLQEDRIVAWKFCHVLHKLLREGYPTTILHSLRHQNELENLGKLWVHLRDCYGKLIRLYCNLLISKLDFHRKNPRFPGNLAITHEELENIGENDINNYFQLSVEMFDYMDTILDLQNAIFGSIDRSRSNSMTSSGQCRLSPLIPCIQDASRLYDFCVKILFKLHSSLPADTLAGHRDRFLKQFKDLKLFYQNTTMLQYFKNLISIPSLPENPPNFLIQAELRTYVTPVVVLPPEEPDNDSVIEGSLIDTSDASPHSDSTDSSHQNGGMTTQHFTEIIAERDYLIEHLQQENKSLRSEIEHMHKKHESRLIKLQDQLITRETELATRESELIQERQLKEDLFQQAAASAQNIDSEQKLRDEKFHKLKEVYTKLREEHIQLIRQKADIDKKLLVSNRSVTEIQTERDELQTEIQSLRSNKDKEENQKLEELIQANIKLQNLQKAHDNLSSENMMTCVNRQYMSSSIESLNCKIQELMTDKISLEKEIEDKSCKEISLEEKIKTLELSQRNVMESSERLKSSIKELYLASVHESEVIVTKAIEETENPAFVATCTPDYFCTLTGSSLDSLQTLSQVDRDNLQQTCTVAIKMAHVLAVYMLQSHALSISSPDIIFGDKMTSKCKELGESLLGVFQGLQNERSVNGDVENAIGHVRAMNELAETLQGTLKENNVDLGDLVENELSSMDKAIEEAVNIIQDMLAKSREADSGIKLEVNGKILDSCKKLMHAIKVLIQKSRLLQAEIVAQGRGSASIKEFYKRNHRWTDGLISAAKAIGIAANLLLNSADEVVTGQGKLEKLAVAAQEIAASTAQLVVASRVKADKNSTNLQQVSTASKTVTNATAEVVATVKDCSSMIDEADEFDATKLTLHAAKRLEMDTQIRVLELEKELEQNRFKLAALRKQHYQLAGEDEGWVS